jgi:hypothetical protein
VPGALFGWRICGCGTVATSSDGLVYGRPEPEQVRALVEQQRVWYDCAGVKQVLTDEEFVRSLPYRKLGWFWAVFVDEATGETIQPEYSPWGDIWRSQ